MQRNNNGTKEWNGKDSISAPTKSGTTVPACRLASSTSANIVPAPPLPVWTIVGEAYRHIGRNFWAYLCQILVWAMILWAGQIVAQIMTVPIVWHLGRVGAGIAEMTFLTAATIACLLPGGGASFLACGQAVLQGKSVRAADVLRLRRVGVFWRTLVIYWFAVHLVPTIGSRVAHVYASVVPEAYRWSADLWVAFIYLCWCLALTPALVMALPISAFEGNGAPFREAFRRSRGNRVRIALYAALAGGPPLALSMVVHYGLSPLATALGIESSNMQHMLMLAFFSAPVRNIFPYLTILCFSSATFFAYLRLSPRFDDVARVFD